MSLFSTLQFIGNHPLNRERQVQSILRFARWQLGSRILPGACVYEWINGSKFLVKTGDTGLTGNIYNGLHEFPDMGFLLHMLREEDLFVDIGANVGSYTILACAAVGAKGVAFEPVPSTYGRLIDNMRLNHLEGRVICLNQGVGAAQGVIAFTQNHDTTNHVLALGEHAEGSINVAVTTLDAALQEQKPALIKIDVEGFETPVLEGAHQTLQSHELKAVIMELNGSGNRYGFNESAICDLMFGLDFRSYSYDPFSRTLTSLEGKNNHSGNTLFIRDQSFVDARIKSAPMVSVLGSRF